MSLTTWKAKYYPKPASKVPARDALAHSLTKWRGLRLTILRRHGVEIISRGDLRSGMNIFCIDAASCALCRHYLDNGCRACPLAIVRGGVPCDQRANEKYYSPFAEWEFNHNPEPMITALELAAQWQRNKTKGPP